ncbi:Antiholin-like protein LrgA [Minicystis rosea]|nr:Antiholin-like protein LrgA [Minicystis rosea]
MAGQAMAQAFVILLGCQLVGEALARGLGLSMPGAVIGMMLLAVALGARRRVPPPLGRGAAHFIRHMPLFFVPAGVGIVAEIERLRAEALPILGALCGSTIAALLVTGWVMHRLAPAEAAR